jgi:hypothetical protein
MSATSDSIFFKIALPTPATWFYFSGLLAVALFFKFSRLLSMRNWDVLTLFLLVPGLLLLGDGPEYKYWGYLSLLTASGYFLARCLADLALVRRPALGPNLSLGGLVWLACSLFVGLITVAVQRPEEEQQASSRETPATLEVVRRRSEDLLRQAPAGLDEQTIRIYAERGLTVVCHLLVVVALALIGWRHFEDLHAGVAAATFYLLLPYVYLLMPSTKLGVGRWDHAWPMALMIWMVLAYRRPRVAGTFLGLAAGSVFFPVLLLPVWLSFYRGRGAGRFALSFFLSAGLCLAVLGGILWFNGELPQSLRTGWTSTAWQPWQKPNEGTPGFWSDNPKHWAYRLPVFLIFAALLIATAFWPSPKNLAHLLALSAALLIGIQFWYADQGGVYILWYLPLLLLLVFRPNLSSCQPPPPGDDWLAWLGRRVRHRLRVALGLARRPEPVRAA